MPTAGHLAADFARDAFMNPVTSFTSRLRTLPAAILLAFAVPATAASPSAWQRARADPRAAQVAQMTFAERHAFARGYGLGWLPAPNATRSVDNCNDSGPGSLRAAVAASASGDVVDASQLACSKISLTTGAVDIGVDSLTIQGPGPDALTIGNGSKYDHRVFNHTGTGQLVFADMTITHGTIRTGGADPGSTGGCINSAGSVVLGYGADSTSRRRGVVVSHCMAISTQADIPAKGGCVYAKSGVTLYGSIVSGCSALANAGGAALGGGVATSHAFKAKYSEIRDNVVSGSSARGGGIFATNLGGDLVDISVKYSTIAGNESSGGAGGIYLSLNVYGLEIRNATISGNRAADGVAGAQVISHVPASGGEILIKSSTIHGNHSQLGDYGCSVGGVKLAGEAIQLQSTIVSGNTCDGQPSDLWVASGTATVTGADNLLGRFEGSVPTAGLIVSDAPGLAPLVNNGGPTRTHALLPGSPAIDHGNSSASVTNDQRGPGFPRVVGTGVIGATADIGAFEFNPNRIFYSSFE